MCCVFAKFDKPVVELRPKYLHSVGFEPTPSKRTRTWVWRLNHSAMNAILLTGDLYFSMFTHRTILSWGVAHYLGPYPSYIVTLIVSPTNPIFAFVVTDDHKIQPKLTNHKDTFWERRKEIHPSKWKTDTRIRTGLGARHRAVDDPMNVTVPSKLMEEKKNMTNGWLKWARDICDDGWLHDVQRKQKTTWPSG